MKKYNKVEDFKIKKFVPFLWDKSIYLNLGCGATALSLLTNRNPITIRMENKNKEHFSDRFILKYLKKYNFKILKLNKKKLLDGKDEFLPFEEILSNNVVLLCCQQLTKNNATWIVYNDNYMYHNLEIMKQKNFDLFQFPVLSSYLVTHNRYE